MENEIVELTKKIVEFKNFKENFFKFIISEKGKTINNNPINISYSRKYLKNNLNKINKSNNSNEQTNIETQTIKKKRINENIHYTKKYDNQKITLNFLHTCIVELKPYFKILDRKFRFNDFILLSKNTSFSIVFSKDDYIFKILYMYIILYGKYTRGGGPPAPAGNRPARATRPW